MQTNLFENNQVYKSKEVLAIAKIGKNTLLKLESTGIIKFILISERIKRYKGSSLNEVFTEQ